MSTMLVSSSRRSAEARNEGAMKPRDLRGYDIGRAIRQAFENEGRLKTGLEAEVDQELRHATGQEARGFLVPWNIPVERRNLGFGGGAGYSGLAAAQTTVPDMLVDVLRAKLVVERLGGEIRNFTPDVSSGGGVALPVANQAATISWVDDGGAPASQSNEVIQQALLKPHTASCYTDVTRRMLHLGGPMFQDHVTRHLLTGLSVAIDGAALNGTSQGNTPLGLFQNSNVSQIVPASDSGNGGAPAWADLVALEKLVGIAGGDSPADARIGFVTSPEGRSILRRTPQLTSGVLPTWKAETCRNPQTGELETLETCMGYASAATINAPRGLTRGSGTGLTAAALGNFSDMIVNLFTGFDVLVNPYLQSTTGVVRISVFVDVDTALLHAGSFAILSAINPA